MNVQSISLDLSKVMSPPPVIRLGQGDRSGTTISATIRDAGASASLDGMAAAFCMRLPGSDLYVRDMSCSVSGSNVSYVVNEEMCCQVRGVTEEAYFEILDGSEVVYSTARFRVEVLRAVQVGAKIPQSWDDRVFRLISELAESIATANEGESSRVAAEAARVLAEAARALAEEGRASAEDGRAAAEDGRAEAERGRVAAEDGRVEAEDGRVTDYAGIRSDAVAATDAANLADERATKAAKLALDAAKAVGDITELAVPLMSETLRGGAKVGFGLRVIEGRLCLDYPNYTWDEPIFGTTWDDLTGTWDDYFEKPLRYDLGELDGV